MVPFKSPLTPQGNSIQDSNLAISSSIYDRLVYMSIL